MLEDLFIAERAAQSRVSCNLQAEDFRNLNASLQTYLDDIKTTDDDNRQLQEQIEQIRTDYILTLEDHLRRLPNDFRQHSQKLTEAHLDRYRWKTRTRRLLAEREETKRRIHFVASDEKNQTKRLTSLQRQDRTVRNELLTINEQIENLGNYLQNEKQTHRQTMEKVDTLRVHLEHICVDRSNTEFEIQTLREEVKLMQTAKDFLDEERQTLLATQSDANNYFLSRLNHSIVRIREDFDQLNQNQLQQIDNDYKQMFQVLEENLLAEHTSAISSNDYERLHQEQQSVAEELTKLHRHNQTLAEQVLAMESDLQLRRDEHREELLSKESQFERCKLELQALNEKLTHFAEYDRNLKFELTLYRGVLESESRRKQQQKVVVPSALHLIRPSTLSTGSNKTITDRTIWTTDTSNRKLSNSQQQKEFEPLNEQTNVQPDRVLSRQSSSNDGKVLSGENLWRQLIEPFTPQQQQQHQDVISTNSRSSLPLKTTQSSSSRTSSTSSGVQKSPTSSTPLISSPVRQLPATPPTLSSISTVKSSDPTISPSRTNSVPTEVNQVSSGASPTNAEMPSKVLNALVSATGVTAPDSQSVSRSSSLSVDDIFNNPKSPAVEEKESPTTATSQLPSTAHQKQQSMSRASSKPTEEHEPTSGSSSAATEVSSDIHQPTLTEEDRVKTLENRQFSSASLTREHQTLSRSSSTNADTESSIQRSATSDTKQTSPVLSRSSSTGAETSSGIQQLARAANVLASTAETRQSPLVASQEHQPLSRTSSVSSEALVSAKRSSVTGADQTVASESNQFSSKPPEVYSSSSPETTTTILALQLPLKPLEEQKSSIVESPKTSTDVSETSSPTFANAYSKTSLTGSTDGEKPSIISIDQANSTTELSLASSSAPEEQISSSPISKTEENSPTVRHSSAIDTDNHSNETNPLFTQNTSRQSSHTASLTDVEEIHSPTSRNFEITSIEDDDSTLAAMMQDLRYAFGELANHEELIEINNDLPDKILDRLEFHDHLTQTVYDALFQKYLVQAAAQGTRLDTLDWVEFRDILFPIVSSRYTERHIRKYFELFDTSKDGYLSVQEITEILEILRANETNDLAQSIIDEYDTDHDGKLNIDEFIEAIIQVDDIHDHILSDDTEHKQWFNEPPIENQTISLEVPTQMEAQFKHGIPLLGRIFRRVGADANTKQLDIQEKNLPAQITDELRNVNREISNEDFEFFIQLYLNQKQKTAPTIDWIEFRNLFLPIVNNGFYSKNDIQRWFDVFDTDSTGLITSEQITRLLRLLQIQNPEEVMQEFIKTAAAHTNKDLPWSFNELFAALANVSATSAYLLTENEENQQITSFDIEWLSRNVF